MLRVSGAFDVLVGGFVEEREESYSDVTDVLDDAVVHDGVATEYEGVVVDGRDGCSGGGTNVREQSGGAGICTDAVEDEIVRWRLRVFVDCGMWAVGVDLEGLAGRAVPGDAVAIDVLEAVTQADLRLCRFLAWHVRDEFGKVVVVDLMGDGVFWSNEHVFEEALLGRCDVCKPTTHLVWFNEQCERAEDADEIPVRSRLS